ncbi:MAG: P-II family nitrogen regulator [Planctomycetota bacterium]
MKLIIALIQPTRLNAVLAALNEAGVQRMTICDSHGYGRQKGQSPMYRGHEYKLQFVRKVALEIAVNDDFLERTLETLESAARTGEGQIGDGKVFVLSVDDAIQLSDGSRGPQAI